jgi:hypothetical protein
VWGLEVDECTVMKESVRDICALIHRYINNLMLREESKETGSG